MRGERGGGVSGSVRLTHLSPSVGLGFGTGVLICVRAGMGVPSTHTRSLRLCSAALRQGSIMTPTQVGKLRLRGWLDQVTQLSLQWQTRFQPRYIVLQTGSD